MQLTRRYIIQVLIDLAFLISSNKLSIICFHDRLEIPQSQDFLYKYPSIHVRAIDFCMYLFHNLLSLFCITHNNSIPSKDLLYSCPSSSKLSSLMSYYSFIPSVNTFKVSRNLMLNYVSINPTCIFVGPSKCRTM